jgi:hypothetical protein
MEIRNMDMEHYVLLVEADVEPYLIGPFWNVEKRNARAKELKREHGDSSGIFWMDVDPMPIGEEKEISVGSYPSSFFEDDLEWKSQDEYLKQPNVCPRCGAHEIDFENIQIDESGASQKCKCAKCFVEWTDDYKLTSYTPID